MVDVPRKVRETLKIVPINHMDQVLAIALSTSVVSPPPKPRKKSEEPCDPAEDDAPKPQE
jgi:ATP-dependent Lon protease